jgi:hypothetical protein
LRTYNIRINNMRQLILVAMVLVMASVSTVAAEEAPSMWMVQNGNTIDLMVNTNVDASGANAWIHFDPTAIDIADIDFTGSPWQPMTGSGWSHQGDHVILALTNFDGVSAGEYQIATMAVTCLTAGETTVTITNAEPAGTVYDLVYVCGDVAPDAGATIAIGDATGSMTLPLMINDATNVGACDVTLNYDPAVVSVTVDGGDMDCTYTNTENTGEGWIRVGAVQGDNPGVDGSFTLLNVTLTPVVDGATCALDLTVTTFKDATPDCAAMTYTISSGTYTSPAPPPPFVNGDANGDGVTDLADTSYIAKYVIGITGYESINEEEADVNGDSLLDMSDSMYLTKHLTGVAGFETLR